MADLLIKHLKKKTEEHSALSLLQNQWGFDEKLIPKALQNIGILFPHYSRHDESHSKQILVNVERLLGDNIQYLTATDTWLLLEAAYWHDIGMVVPQTTMQEAFQNKEFKIYLMQIRNSPKHELHRFVSNFDYDNMSTCFAGADNPLDALDKFRQLMAEWFRRSHATRAVDTIQTPWESAGISSPRTELIPSRLFKLLGSICHFHGLPFSDLHKQLHYRAAGMAQEDCHPRFVACMLRLGDLLDLDDNRFCPVMQRIAGEQRPAISRAHEDKHASIRHLRMDMDRIEVSAECETIDGYLETFKWFDWLKKEIQDQKSCWQEIVPNKLFGYLPTLGTFSVNMGGGLQILQQGERPQFSVDMQSAIRMMQGDNLYNAKYVCVRELLQNAVDATLLSLWLSVQRNKDKYIRPDTDDTKALLASKSILIELREEEVIKNKNGDESRCVFEIIDYGTGISRNDLRYMLEIGGSQKNLARQFEISKMPEWMKPSGVFGIGLQSVFRIVDEITIVTKSIFTNETLEISMHSPTGEKSGLVIIKVLPNDFSQQHGTKIQIHFNLPREQGTIASYSDKHSAKFIASRDPITTDYIGLGVLNMADDIELYTRDVPIPVVAILKGLMTIEPIELRTNYSLKQGDKNAYFYLNENGDCLYVTFSLMHDGLPRISSMYRGQFFENNALGFIGFYLHVNLLSGKAGEWLTVNREKLKGTANRIFRETVLNGFFDCVNNVVEENNFNDEELKNLSLSLAEMAYQYSNDARWKTLAKKIGDKWLDLYLPDKTKTYSTLFKMKTFTIGVLSLSGRYLDCSETCDLILEKSGRLPTLNMLLCEWENGGDNRIVNIVKAETDALDLKLQLGTLEGNAKINNQKLCSENELASQFVKVASQKGGLHIRYLLQDYGKWKKLHLKAGTVIDAGKIFDFHFKSAGYVLLPFLFHQLVDDNDNIVTASSERVDQLCRWIQPHLIENLTHAEITNEYKKFIKWVDSDVMSKNPDAKDKWIELRK